MSWRMYSDGVVPSTSASFLNWRAVDSVTCETIWSEHLFISGNLLNWFSFQFSVADRLYLPLTAIRYARCFPLRDSSRADI